MLNENIIGKIADFKKYIRSMILLNPESEYDFLNGFKDLHLGAVFTLNPKRSNKFLLRVTVRPSRPHVAVFQLAQTN